MNRKVKYLSRIHEEFDTVICGVNGVMLSGENIKSSSIDALMKLYQNGKNICIASNSSLRVLDLYQLLKHKGVPMEIFSAMVTAGEVAHFYLKNDTSLGNTYYNLAQHASSIANGLPYRAVDSLVLADFMVAETDDCGFLSEKYYPQLEQALQLGLPLLCIGNDVTVISSGESKMNAGAVAEQYAMMGGKIISFGKPDVRMASYLTEDITSFDVKRCLVIGDCMSTDIRMGNNFGAKTLFLTSGVHQLHDHVETQLEDLAEHYGLQVDYYTEDLQW